MKKQLAKLALTAALGLALTLLACEDKEKKPAAAPPTQEAAATTLTDPRDKKTYKTVKIGEQVWMAENLNYDVPGNDTTDVCYDNKPENCQKYGRLYDGEIAKKACPSGWHLPSREEWEALEATAGGNKNKLIAKSGWEEDYYGTDEYGFSALPGGKYGYLDPEACEDGCEPSFWDAGSAGRWWSSTEGFGSSSYSWYIGQDFEDRDGGYIYNASLRSVRCIQN